jgi:hypothetical protein
LPDDARLAAEALRAVRKMNKRAKGSCRHDDPQRLHPQIVARFDRETFDEIAAFAERKEWSFNSALRLLVEWGLMAEKRRSPQN